MKDVVWSESYGTDFGGTVQSMSVSQSLFSDILHKF